MRLLARWLVWFVLSLLILLAVAVAAVFVLRTYLLPDLATLHPRIEAQLSESIKQPVRFEGLSTDWNWVSVDVRVKSIEIGSPTAPSATLKGTHTRVLLHPLLAGELRTEFLNVDSASLNALQTGTPAAPQWRVAGFDLNERGDGAGLRWLLNQGGVRVGSLNVAVQDPTQHWLPEKNTLLKLSAVSLQNRGVQHTVAAQFANGFSDARLGGQASFNASFSHARLKDIAQFKHWTGTASMALPNVRMASTLAWAQPLLNLSNTTQTSSAKGDWTRWAAQTLPNATLNASTSVAFEQGALSAKGTVVWADLPDGAAQAVAPLSWAWAGAEPSHTAAKPAVHRLQLDTAKLSLAPLGQFVQGMPLPKPLADALAQARAVGELSTLKATLQISKIGIESVDASAVFSQLGLKTIDWQGDKGVINIPTIAGLSGTVRVAHTPQQTRSTIELNANQAYAELPRLLAQPRLDFERIEGQIEVLLNPEQTRLKLTQLKFKNVDIDGQLSGEYFTATRHSTATTALGTAQFTGEFAKADLAQLHRYMPLTLSDNARRWLRHTVAQGEARDLTLALNGDLSRFPFLPDVAQAGERFDLRTTIRSAVLNFNPLTASDTDRPATAAAVAKAQPWPLLENVTGELRLQGLSLSLSNMEGQIKPYAADELPITLRMPTLQIASLTAPVLVFQAKASTTAANVLALVRGTPLAPQAFTDQLNVLKTTSGTVSVDAALSLNIATPANNLTEGSMVLQDVGLDINRELPPFERINATLTFKQGRVTVGQASGRWLGGDVTMTGALDTQDATQAMRVQGTAQLGIIKQYTPNLMAQALLARATGALDYTWTLGSTVQGYRSEITADLTDTTLKWPGVLDKAAGVPLPFSLTRKPTQRTLSTAAGVSSSISQDTWEATLGSTVLGPFKASIERQLDAQRWRVLRGAVALGAQAELNTPEQGLGVHITAPVLNLDRLQADIAALPWAALPAPVKPISTAPLTAQAGSATARFTPPPETPQWMPSVLALQVDDLTLAGRRFSKVVGAAVRTSAPTDSVQQWQANLVAKGINGYITWKDSLLSDGLGGGEVVANLSELSIPSSELASTSKALLDVSPEQIPSIELTVGALTLGERPIGAITLKANHLIDGKIAKGWNIEQLTVTQPQAVLQSKGSWTRENAFEQGLVQLSVELKTSSLGAALETQGLGKVMAGASGSVTGNIRWRGTPFALDIPSLSGQLKAEFGKGQFLKVDPGAARLLTLFSLQNLPRRLSLDFKDTFGTGFAFDAMSATANIDNGVLKTNDFLMRSNAAKVSAQGQVSLVNETQSLVFTVKPEINAGSVSLLYMLINPPVGLATLAAQWLFREPLSKAFTVEYEITGPWVKPEVKQLKREFR